MLNLSKTGRLSQICHKAVRKIVRKKTLFLLVILLVAFLSWHYLAPAKFEKSSLYIQSGSRMWPIEIEVARTGKQKERGLMFRRRLPEGTGMIFLYEEQHAISMWMKNTYIPLDMLFIKDDGTIVCVKQNARPRSLDSITCEHPTIAVLELPGGAAKRRMIKVGDTVLHPFFSPGRQRR